MMVSRINDVLSHSGIEFGTSGARGLVEQFTDDVCAAFSIAFLKCMQAQYSVKRVAIGMDRRPSSPAIAAVCSAAARSIGVEVVNYGILPTPALALQAMADGAPAIMVTGSHIPFDRNGIKFYRPDGEITKADEQAILGVSLPLTPLSDTSFPPVNEEAIQHYIQRYVQWFGEQALAGKRVGVYQHSAAGRDLNVEVLEALGATAIPLGRSEVFVPIDTEAVSEDDRARSRAWALEYGFDAILTTDGDGDRPLVADEQGEWLRGDTLGLLCARELGIQALAVPVSCNTAIEKCDAFAKVLRTRIGSPYVLAGIEELVSDYQIVAGFEANGGFILGTDIQKEGRALTALPTRDALLPALALMVMAARQAKPLSTLRDDLPSRYTASDRLKGIPAEDSQAILANFRTDLPATEKALGLEHAIEGLDATDGLRMTLSNGDIVHLRASGNAPELRCYAESASEAMAAELVRNTIHKVSEKVSELIER